MIFKATLIALALAIFIAIVEYFSIGIYQDRIDHLEQKIKDVQRDCRIKHFEDIWQERIDHNETHTSPDLSVGTHILKF